MKRYYWRDKIPPAMVQRGLFSWWCLFLIAQIIKRGRYHEFFNCWRWFGWPHAKQWWIHNVRRKLNGR